MSFDHFFMLRKHILGVIFIIVKGVNYIVVLLVVVILEEIKRNTDINKDSQTVKRLGKTRIK